MAVNVEQDAAEKANWHWRNSMRPIRFFKFDARAAFPYVLLILHFRISTIVFVICTTMVFWILEKNGLTFSAAIRKFRLYFAGDFRPALASFKRRRLKDYG